MVIGIGLFVMWSLLFSYMYKYGVIECPEEKEKADSRPLWDYEKAMLSPNN